MRGRSKGSKRGKGASKAAATPPSEDLALQPVAPVLGVPSQAPKTPPPAYVTPQVPFPRPVTPPNASHKGGDAIAPIIVSPIKPRARRAPAIARMSDSEVWDMADEEIIAASFSNTRSLTYAHYNISIERVYATGGAKEKIVFIFTCKTDPDNHAAQKRARGNTAAGTGNLVATEGACLKRHGLSRPGATQSQSLPYSEALHHVLIALRCAASTRPFDMILDKWYQAEVEMLRPGTKLPHPVTVSRDLKRLYAGMSTTISNFFINMDSTLHLVLDGWTSPLVSSYLGVVVVWCQNGAINRMILDFIRLKQSHTGEYMATLIHDCVSQFGIADMIFSLCMDNASNCDKLAEKLGELLPSFDGMNSRVRCFAHVLNLIAKVFISFFFKQKKSKKAVRIPASSGRQAGCALPFGLAASNEEETILEAGDDDDADGGADQPAILEESELTAEATQDDDGHAAHNTMAVKSIRQRAIDYMRTKHKVTFTAAEEKLAGGLFPKVAGLARRVHDSSTLKEEFDGQVRTMRNMGRIPEGNKTRLDRRVPTRWNSDLACLEAHLYFEPAVRALIGSNRNLLAFELTSDQWKLAHVLEQCLAIFEGPTKLFSQSEVPMIVDVISMLSNLGKELQGIRDDQLKDEDDPTQFVVPNIVRVAAHAGMMMVDKYSMFSTQCDIYQIAIVMCPDRKLEWFKSNGFSMDEIAKIRKLVEDRFSSRYQKEPPVLPNRPSTAQPSRSAKKSRFVISLPEETTSAAASDHISTYLDEGVVPTSQIKAAGGYLKWWAAVSKNRPQVSKMALDYCSAPASSVDAERAFSVGRRQVSHLQHNMNSQTFKARMCVGSWANSVACPPLSELQKILEDPVSTAKGEKKQYEGNTSDGEDFTAELGNISAVDSDDD